MLPQQHHKTRASAYFFLASQILLLCSVTGALSLFGLTAMAYSAFLGGFVCLAANYCSIRQAFPKGRTTARQALNRLYFAEVMKWIVTIILFSLIIKYIQPIMLPFFTMYIATTMVVWLTPFFFKNATKL